MLDNGCNLSEGLPTLAFRIEDEGGGPKVKWDAAPLSITPDEAMAAEAQQPRDKVDEAECDTWPRQLLADGPLLSKRLYEMGTAAGFSEDQVKRAKKRVGTRARKLGYGEESRWSVQLNQVNHCPSDGSKSADVQRWEQPA